MCKIRNIKKEGKKVIITFDNYPKDFQREVKIMEKIRIPKISNYSEKLFLNDTILEIYDPRLNKLTLDDLRQNFMYRKIFRFVYETISENHLVLKISLNDWYIENEENIKLYRYISFKEINDHHYYCSKHLRVDEGKFKKYCLENGCLGSYAIDFKEFWNSSTESWNCIYKCDHCGKKISAMELKKILEKEEEERE